jgi:hypothetical protein
MWKDSERSGRACRGSRIRQDRMAKPDFIRGKERSVGVLPAALSCSDPFMHIESWTRDTSIHKLRLIDLVSI